MDEDISSIDSAEKADCVDEIMDYVLDEIEREYACVYPHEKIMPGGGVGGRVGL